MRKYHSDEEGMKDIGGSRSMCFMHGLDLDPGTWRPPGKPLAK